MAVGKVEVIGYIEHLPGNKDHFHWSEENANVLGAWATFCSRFTAHLRNTVPFVVEDHELIASMKVEVRLCDS